MCHFVIDWQKCLRYMVGIDEEPCRANQQYAALITTAVTDFYFIVFTSHHLNDGLW